MKSCALLLTTFALSLFTLYATPEPRLSATNAKALIATESLEGWNVPGWNVPNPQRWSVSQGVITGDTQGEKLTGSEWIYTEDEYGDFIFSAEIKISGANPQRVNSGIYFRAQIIPWREIQAPSGYEFDVAFGRFNASVGDFFGRGPAFRFPADQDLVNSVFSPDQFNRFTLRAQGNHLQYWINGTLVNELRDEDEQRNLKGLIGIQLHGGMAMKMEMKNAFIKEL